MHIGVALTSRDAIHVKFYYTFHEVINAQLDWATCLGNFDSVPIYQ